MKKVLMGVFGVVAIALPAMAELVDVKQSDIDKGIYRTLTNGNTYRFVENIKFTAPMGESALKVANEANVFIEIPAGIVVQLTGGAAGWQNGAGAGIEVPESATLNIIGFGRLEATGGNAGNGSQGTIGLNTFFHTSDTDFSSTWHVTSASGGYGGVGGGGAGAGIGGRGGNGGAGGAGGAGIEGKWNATTPDTPEKYLGSGKAGAGGGIGGGGGTCGTVIVQDVIDLRVKGGAAGTGGAGGGWSEWGCAEGVSSYGAGYGGGGGGGGGGGLAGNDIGGGGGGAGGGGGISYTYEAGKGLKGIAELRMNGYGGAGGGGGGAVGATRSGTMNLKFTTYYKGYLHEITANVNSMEERSNYIGGASGTPGQVGPMGGDGKFILKSSYTYGEGGSNIRPWTDNEGRTFVPIEYIESTGLQYIDTGYVHTSNTKIICEVALNKDWSSQHNQVVLFGAHNLKRRFDNFSAEIYRDGERRRFAYLGAKVAESYSGEDCDLKFFDTRMQLTFKGESVVFSTPTDSIRIFRQGEANNGRDNFFIFDANCADVGEVQVATDLLVPEGVGASVKLYSFDIYDGETLVRSFTPVIKIENGEKEVGLFDLKTGKFFANQGQGAFLSPVVTIDYDQLDAPYDIGTLAMPVRFTKPCRVRFTKSVSFEAPKGASAISFAGAGTSYLEIPEDIDVELTGGDAAG